MTPAPHLSPLEREIATLMAAGYCYAEIAVTLHWKPASVRQAAHRLAERLPGPGSPVVRILRWELRRQLTQEAA